MSLSATYVTGRIGIEQLKNVHATLGARGYADQEVERKQTGNKNFAILSYQFVFITQSSNYGFGSTELAEKIDILVEVKDPR